MKTSRIFYFFLILYSAFLMSCNQESPSRLVSDFNADWYFQLADSSLAAEAIDFDHSAWRQLDVPHDWSIEGEFSADHPATAGGGALPGGIGWYRKSFTVDTAMKGKKVYVQFDGIYMNSQVWINGQVVGERPFGYISFEYDITPYLKYGPEQNVIAVKVSNSPQPNSRWYSGSGIYRNTRLVMVDPIHVAQWGTFVTTPEIKENEAAVSIETTIRNTSSTDESIELVTMIFDAEGLQVSNLGSSETLEQNENTVVSQQLRVTDPNLWSLDNPYLYTAKTEVKQGDKVLDQYETKFGIRSIAFDQEKGFFLNGESVKMKGVCLHHDLGCLGSAVNTRALERQLEIMMGMGVNAIRTSHNPPTPEQLDLCDKMGILVMDETFDIWSMKKSPYDYALHWEDWHTRDLNDHILRDRNHPSVFSWSIGNEIIDQWHPKGDTLARELAAQVRALDTTRFITAAMNPPAVGGNSIAGSGALDLMGYNYHHEMYEEHNKNWPNTPFIATETTSALATRGYYDEQSDTLKRWPIRWDLEFTQGNPDNTVSAYDQVSAPWGSTHEETWKVMKRNAFLSGMFIWTGFDYIGEPTPYTWPSRSSYFGVVDLAGFPKDSYYMYKSEWTEENVLHIFPHWNWTGRDTVDVWAYFNAEEVELFLNGKSLGSKKKEGEELHVMWQVAYEPGELKAISRSNGVVVLEKTINTAGDPVSIRLTPDRTSISADGKDLSFVTVEVLDADGNPVPNVANNIEFTVSGNGKLVGVDNGDPTSHVSLKGSEMKIFNGKCLAVIQSGAKAGSIALKATSDGLTEASVTIQATN